ncbi:hypothetical protein PVAND_002102 [Polypedilum vanderplanki]|uniref:SAYSvFN domain-containing protein n=1 Tax=Polypedilum vanderplanki TaxID=319348 RepID=A0A9J6BRD1_POLVA|nr:hypothetical protein PVAND_002102 [Polypedilum vanderplanki]
MVSINILQSDNVKNDTNINIEPTNIRNEVSEENETESTTSTDLKIIETSSSSRSWLTYCTWLIYFLIWITLYAIAIELSFGTVYFMFSLLLGICLNTREKPKGKKEVSAYSVFNENCESIDGTFKAEMFEKQLGIRL